MAAAPQDPVHTAGPSLSIRSDLERPNVGVAPLPNPTRHSDAKWDAYLYVPDPDALAAGDNTRGDGR